MINLSLPTKIIGLVLIGWLFIYTLLIVRSKKISAQMALSWVLTEIIVFALLLFDGILSKFTLFIGETNTTSVIYIIIFAWIVSLMLDTLKRVSSLNGKITAINQELALLKQSFNEFENREPNPKK
jgi:hypothetical protein